MKYVHNIAPVKDMIGYLSGPVDAREVHSQWEQGRPTAYFGTSYLQQFFTVVSQRGATGHVLTSHDGEAYDVVRGDFRISNRPRARGLAGWRYHWRELQWTIAALRDLCSNGTSTVVLTDAQNYWFLTLLWRLRGTRFINALHCAIRPPFAAEPLHLRLLLWLTGMFHYAFGDAALSASPLIKDQLDRMPGKSRRRVMGFLPSYLPEHFADIHPRVDGASRPASILFAGRIERNKGVFDLLDAAEILIRRHGQAVGFDICGDGSDLADLRRTVTERNLTHSVRIHGFCDRASLVTRFDACDIVVVPTRTDFEEGFAMIVAEGVIAGRPVVTSRVCPALEVVREACVEAEPDDPASYADAISTLIEDKHLYQQKTGAALGLRLQFFDPASSYGVSLTSCLALEPSHRPYHGKGARAMLRAIVHRLARRRA